MNLTFQSKRGGASNAAAASSDGLPPAAKRAGVKSSQEEKEQIRVAELLKIISKLVLSNSLSCRTLKAIVIQCLRLKTESTWVTIHKQARVEYVAAQADAKIQGASQEEFKEQCGIPSVWGTNYWFKHLVKLMKEEMQKAAGQSDQNQETKNKIEVMDKETQLVEESMKMWDRYG